MFALIHNNLINVGPREWSYWIFRQYLEDNGLDYSDLPYLATESIISTDWKILKITELIEPSHNPLFEEYSGPFWTIYDTYITGYYNVINSSINTIKGHMKEIVAANRYTVEVKGIEFTFSDNTTVELYTNREDRNVYLDALMIMQDTDTIDFKFKNGIFKNITKSELQSIVTVGSQYIKNAFTWESNKITAIDNAQSIDELKLIELRHPLQINET